MEDFLLQQRFPYDTLKELSADSHLTFELNFPQNRSALTLAMTLDSSHFASNFGMFLSQKFIALLTTSALPGLM